MTERKKAIGLFGGYTYGGCNQCSSRTTIKDGVCHRCRLENELIKAEAKISALKGLLNEAVDWICLHREAAEQQKASPGTRVWCCDCHNYVRDLKDTTLRDRIRGTLEDSG